MLTITTVPVTIYEQNARVLVDTKNQEAVVVDPGGDVDRIIAVIPPATRLRAIWITHSHIDHVGGVADLLARYPGAPIAVMAHPDDGMNQALLELQSQRLGIPYSGAFRVTDTVHEGMTVCIGDHDFTVYETPGHAQGHVSYFLSTSINTFKGPLVLSGDTVFQRGMGRTDLPGGNYDQLIESIKTKLMTLPPETVVLSGHGPSTTIHAESQIRYMG